MWRRLLLSHLCLPHAVCKLVKRGFSKLAESLSLESKTDINETLQLTLSETVKDGGFSRIRGDEGLMKDSTFVDVVVRLRVHP